MDIYEKIMYNSNVSGFSETYPELKEALYTYEFYQKSRGGSARTVHGSELHGLR